MHNCLECLVYLLEVNLDCFPLLCYKVTSVNLTTSVAVRPQVPALQWSLCRGGVYYSWLGQECVSGKHGRRGGGSGRGGREAVPDCEGWSVRVLVTGCWIEIHQHIIVDRDTPAHHSG